MRPLMTQTGGQPGTEPLTILNRAVLVVATQVGCLTLVLILVSSIVGIWLDRTLQTLPLFTILFLVGSMPVSWVMIFWLVNRAKKSLMQQPFTSKNRVFQWEESDGDRE